MPHAPLRKRLPRVLIRQLRQFGELVRNPNQPANPTHRVQQKLLRVQSHPLELPLQQTVPQPHRILRVLKCIVDPIPQPLRNHLLVTLRDRPKHDQIHLVVAPKRHPIHPLQRIRHIHDRILIQVILNRRLRLLLRFLLSLHQHLLFLHRRTFPDSTQIHPSLLALPRGCTLRHQRAHQRQHQTQNQSIPLHSERAADFSKAASTADTPPFL